jgi:hypothetical protein
VATTKRKSRSGSATCSHAKYLGDGRAQLCSGPLRDPEGFPRADDGIRTRDPHRGKVSDE